MKLWNLLLNGVQLPRKKAMFALNRTGMDWAMIYTFVLLLIASIPALLERLLNPDPPEMNAIFTILYFFMFYYLPLVIMMLIAVAGVAYVVTFIAKLRQRKLKYQIFLKMGLYALAVPLLLYTILVILFPVTTNDLWYALIYVFVVLNILINHYPKKRRK